MVDRVTREIGAPPAAVCAAFLDQDALAEWLPPDGMTGELSEADLREGGGFTMTLTYDVAPEGGGKTTPDSDVTRVEVLGVEPDRRVVWGVDFESDDPGFSGRMTMTWTFEAIESGTRVAVDLTDVPAGIDAEVHGQGIRASLANLADHLEA